jgi:uncharacterized protein (TIGR02145 family)
MNLKASYVGLIIIAITSLGACSVSRSGSDIYAIRDKEGNSYKTMTMPDGKQWTIENIKANLPESFCYDNLESNCSRYGRLYTWKTAVTVCQQLGDEWRLPRSDEWQGLAKHYGGVFGDSDDNGKAAFIALMDGGSSKFNALLSGGGDPNGGFWRVEAHGFYWTSTEVSDSTAWFGNFGKGRPALYLQNDGGKTSAFAVRCVKDKTK